jgi:hypothetical protein
MDINIGMSILREIAEPNDRHLGLCIRLCPDEPMLSSENADDAMEKWRAECMVSKWSAIAPLSVSEDGCISGVLKNTFVHITPAPAAMRGNGALRRSNSVPKDMGSSKCIWDVARHVFSFAQAGFPRDADWYWAGLSKPADSTNLKDLLNLTWSTAAPDSDVVQDEYEEEDEDEEWRSWQGEGHSWQPHRGPERWYASARSAPNHSRWTEKWWQKSRSKWWLSNTYDTWDIDFRRTESIQYHRNFDGTKDWQQPTGTACNKRSSRSWRWNQRSNDSWWY